MLVCIFKIDWSIVLGEDSLTYVQDKNEVDNTWIYRKCHKLDMW